MKPVELLLVEDSEPRREKCLAIARELGFRHVLAATNIEEAEKYVRDNDEIQLAVVDIGLPRTYGDEPKDEHGLSFIRSLAKEKRGCLIIAITGLYDTDMGVNALNQGASDFLSAKWIAINFYELLSERLKLWRGLIQKYGIHPVERVGK